VFCRTYGDRGVESIVAWDTCARCNVTPYNGRCNYVILNEPGSTAGPTAPPAAASRFPAERNLPGSTIEAPAIQARNRMPKTPNQPTATTTTPRTNLAVSPQTLPPNPNAPLQTKTKKKKMGLLSSIFPPSEADKRATEVRTGAVAPSRAERQKCWEARDAYFACLDAHGVVDALKDDKAAARACGSESAGFEKDCATQWVSLPYLSSSFGLGKSGGLAVGKPEG